eukprot:Hpha_TRINITY_DN4643_c0_g1::TRINITY_DN4643_c0_g1_i1::g.97077::m.97077
MVFELDSLASTSKGVILDAFRQVPGHFRALPRRWPDEAVSNSVKYRPDAASVCIEQAFKPRERLPQPDDGIRSRGTGREEHTTRASPRRQGWGAEEGARTEEEALQMLSMQGPIPPPPRWTSGPRLEKLTLPAGGRLRPAPLPAGFGKGSVIRLPNVETLAAHCAGRKSTAYILTPPYLRAADSEVKVVSVGDGTVWVRGIHTGTPLLLPLSLFTRTDDPPPPCMRRSNSGDTEEGLDPPHKPEEYPPGAPDRWDDYVVDEDEMESPMRAQHLVGSADCP